MEVLFIKINFIDMLNQYLANVIILRNNLYNLHFNIIGEGSVKFHEELANYITTINNIYDTLAEAIKARGGFVIMDPNKISEISNIPTIKNQSYTSKEAKNIVLRDFSTINHMNNQLGEYSLKNREYDIFNLVLEFNKFLSKKIWFLTMEKV